MIPNLVMIASLFSESATADFALVAAVSTALHRDINKPGFGMISPAARGKSLRAGFEKW